MARTEEEIRRALATSFKEKSVTVLAKVTAVNTAARTCDIDDDGVEMFGIRLQSITDGTTGITIWPKVGCQVLCLRIEEADGYTVVQTAEVDKLEIQVQDKSLTADGNGFVFNGGTVGSVKADKMIEWMTKVYADLQTLISLLSLSPVAGNGAALGIVFNPQTPQPQLSAMTDDLLKH